MELKRLQKRLGITFIYITHDQEEALNMSDRIAVMRNGRFEQIDTPSKVYDHPKTSYVARFVGSSNVFRGKIKSISHQTIEFENQNGRVLVDTHGIQVITGKPITIAVRGEMIKLIPCESNHGKQLGFQGIVKEKRFAGGVLQIITTLADGNEIVSKSHGIDLPLRPGDNVIATWQPQNAVLVDLEKIV